MTNTRPAAIDADAQPLDPIRELDVRHVAHTIPLRAAPAATIYVAAELENTGSLPWRSSSPDGAFDGLAVFWEERAVANHMLPRPSVAPGERCTLRFALEMPTTPGVHHLALKMVRYHVAVYEERGASALRLDIAISAEAPDRTGRLWSTLQQRDASHYIPTRGVSRLKDGTSLPVFIDRAEGCRIWDTNGREYIDYTMGWGSVLLGYAHPKVALALSNAARTGPTLSYPQPVEMEVAERLCEDFPSAEMVCFAKNGSDACTFAARLARVTTGRRTILFSGYHGWQDFWAEQVGFDRTGVLPRDPQIIHRFPFLDLQSFQELYERHKHDLAAVFIEPSPWAGNGLGFEPDADGVYLRAIARMTRQAGALLVFDEIVTGYRYPEKSVQAAKGVLPDLTCLGKAIASGSPLSAVVGRADIFRQSLPRVFFGATFHAESHSLHAARASIDVYRSEPVAAHVWDYGTRLRDGLNRLFEQLGVHAEVWGPPFRMNVRFIRADESDYKAERTLYQQELLRGGISTIHGTIMLPCYAHDEATLARTLEVQGRALEVVARAGEKGDWYDRLEIPLLVEY